MFTDKGTPQFKDNNSALHERLKVAGWEDCPLVINYNTCQITASTKSSEQSQIAAQFFTEVNSILPDEWRDIVTGRKVFSAYQPQYHAGRLIAPKDSHFASGLGMDAMLYLFRNDLKEDNFQSLLECTLAYTLKIKETLIDYTEGNAPYLRPEDARMYAAYLIHVFSPFS